MGKIIENIIIVLGIILVAGVGWYMFTENQRMALDVESANIIQAEIQGFIQTQNTLRTINIDTTILSTERFINLQTITEAIDPQPRGRSNPFVSEI